MNTSNPLYFQPNCFTSQISTKSNFP